MDYEFNSHLVHMNRLKVLFQELHSEKSNIHHIFSSPLLFLYTFHFDAHVSPHENIRPCFTHLQIIAEEMTFRDLRDFVQNKSEFKVIIVLSIVFIFNQKLNQSLKIRSHFL
jgi:hypothetical protein